MTGKRLEGKGIDKGRNGGERRGGKGARKMNRKGETHRRQEKKGKKKKRREDWKT